MRTYGCLQKGDKPDGSDRCALRSAKDTRPLSGSNCDAKSVVSTFRFKVDPILQWWAHSSQHGFIGNRSMLENVVDIDTHSISATLNPDNKAVLLLFDFSAAFPSIAHAFIWLALEMMGFPILQILRMEALYANNYLF